MSVTSRKLRRTVSGLVNLANLAPYLIAGEPHYSRIIKALDRESIKAIISQFTGVPDFCDGRKYLRIRMYLRDSVARAVALGLDSHPPIRVLDLGSGAGYFLLACRHFGHEVLGFDLPANEFYRAMFQHFRLPRVEGTIRPLTRVEGLEGRFDLITAFAVTFAKARRIGETDDWGRGEWLFFFDDMSRHLNPGGRLFLRLNLLQVRGLLDPEEFDFLHARVAGFDVHVLNRREVCLTAIA